MVKNIYIMNEFTIGITTFSKRYDYVEKLIPQIRRFNNNKIILIINGEKDGLFDEGYRVKILDLCVQFKNVFPIFFIETRGLTKLWNTAIVISDSENILMLNDDIEIQTNEIFETTTNHIVSNNYTGLTKINGSFSHYIINKQLMDTVGYFDERLLGFGEEDGDITYRLLKENININNISCGGIINIVSNIRHEHIIPGIGKYSSFNREFIYNEKYAPNMRSQYKGMFDTPMEQLLADINQYPYEKFFKENKEKL